jgi:hypothetical protein
MQNDHYSRTHVRSLGVDLGLRTHMNKIYAKMTSGVLVTGIIALVVGSSPLLQDLFLGGPQKYIVIFAPLAIIWFGFNPMTMSASKLKMAFFGVSVLYGVSFAAIAGFAAADPAFGMTLAKAFFVASAMFAGLSIYGYTTKTDLTPIRTFLTMGIIGLVAVSLMNLLIQSDVISNALAGIGILLFSGLTVWQTQEMKEMYHSSVSQEQSERYAWAAALNLYISFTALFQYILHFMNQR